MKERRVWERKREERESVRTRATKTRAWKVLMSVHTRACHSCLGGGGGDEEGGAAGRPQAEHVPAQLGHVPVCMGVLVRGGGRSCSRCVHAHAYVYITQVEASIALLARTLPHP